MKAPLHCDPDRPSGLQGVLPEGDTPHEVGPGPSVLALLLGPLPPGHQGQELGPSSTGHSPPARPCLGVRCWLLRGGLCSTQTSHWGLTKANYSLGRRRAEETFLSGVPA